VIIDVPRFVAAEHESWKELEKILDRLEADPLQRMPVDDVRRFHFLYQKASADLARLSTFAFEPQIYRYLESLVARAYGEVHESREKRRQANLGRLVWSDFPQTFRRHVSKFWLATGIMLIGAIFGAGALKFDPTAKPVLLPFSHLQGSPAERVAHEEQAKKNPISGSQSTFSAFLMTHNIRISIFAFSAGITAGLGTTLLLFYNGIILGAVALDYIAAGQTKFLLGWLLPHGVIEIPAILIAGQAGLLLGAALIGWKSRTALRERLRNVSGDLVILVLGFAVLLVWAGLVEAFFSQWHEPVIPYSLKIGFGIVELILLVLFLSRSSRQNDVSRAR
jgi:uncharacterized membrane protein SpoIIM required for sporulation